jgi:hypothetical protein
VDASPGVDSRKTAGEDSAMQLKYQPELAPKGLMYNLSVATRDEALRIIDWLERNT